jgi:sulfoxide reductase heme-binding subunit YedZ
MLPWTDRAGNLSVLKLAVFLAALVPAALLIEAAWSGTLGAKPITEAIHQTGFWAIRFVLLSLAITPLRRITQWSRLILVRRMLGLFALGYALCHLSLYALDQNWNLGHVASEIALRIYLLIGFTALTGLAMLGATSSDTAIRRLGRNWGRLHKVIYAIAPLAALHFFMQSKANATEATLTAGLLLLLIAYRVAHRLDVQLRSWLALAVIALICALGTAALEYAWYALATGIAPMRVLDANFNFSIPLRPAWWVLIVGLAVALLPLPRIFARRRAKRPAPMSHPTAVMKERNAA